MQKQASISLCLVGSLMALTSCAPADPLLAHLDERRNEGDAVAVPLADVYGDHFTHFGLVCPDMPSQVAAETLGLNPADLPDYTANSEKNALVRWNDTATEYSEFDVDRVHLCAPAGAWEPFLTDPVAVFRQSNDGTWILR